MNPKGIQTKIFTSVTELPKEDWNKVRQGRKIYLSLPYLEALESTGKGEIDFYYTIAYSSERNPIFIAAFQLVNFIYRGKKYSKLLLRRMCKFQTKEEFNLALLVAGNVFSNGENGFLCSEDVTYEEANSLLISTIKKLTATAEVKKKHSIVLIKEFWPTTLPSNKTFQKKGYFPFQIDDNMVLPIHENWQTVADYLENMKTKFRTKIHGILKKSASLSMKELDHEEIRQLEPQIGTLFKNVVARYAYSLGAIEPKSFAAFKKELGEDFIFTGIFKEQQLVGFSTGFLNGDRLEANYVGIDYTLNQEYAIYQRLIYNFVEKAIALQKKELHLGRTSETIKSSFGAIPVGMTLYAKHKSRFLQPFLVLGLKSVRPSEYEQRPPFKKEINHQWIH